jgi:hypothetical protein
MKSMIAHESENENYSISATTAAGNLPRFRIQSLMWVIDLIAVGFAFNRRLHPLLTVLIMMFPLSVVLEGLFGERPRMREPQPPILPVPVVDLLECPVALSYSDIFCHWVFRFLVRGRLGAGCAISGGLLHSGQRCD